ncbi:MAG: TetR family transcriptional regulator [Marmoricola sp.]|nr:TetR family transcriptional regulator [Marmoricola sp.]
MRRLVRREEYFDTAMRVLATGGPRDLKIGRLCRALEVTTGSFYGYFGSFDGFVGEFLAHWEASQTQRIVEIADKLADPAERIHTVKELAGAMPHAAEAAIRSWAHHHPIVADAQKRVDERRVAALTDILEAATENRDEAYRLALMGMTLLVGLQQWRSPITKTDFDLIFDQYEQMVTSRLPRKKS